MELRAPTLRYDWAKRSVTDRFGRKYKYIELSAASIIDSLSGK